jgi:hypothetical protein
MRTLSLFPNQTSHSARIAGEGPMSTGFGLTSADYGSPIRPVSDHSQIHIAVRSSQSAGFQGIGIAPEQEVDSIRLSWTRQRRTVVCSKRRTSVRVASNRYMTLLCQRQCERLEYIDAEPNIGELISIKRNDQCLSIGTDADLTSPNELRKGLSNDRHPDRVPTPLPRSAPLHKPWNHSASVRASPPAHSARVYAR